jgi:predicted dehydrogenase
MVNLGIAGMGYIGRVHLEASRKVPEAQVVAVATLQPNPILDSYPGVRVYSSYKELLEDDRLDAVVICLPTDLHEQVALEAAERGRHVLCEKPMGLDAASARRMLGAAQAHGCVLMVAHILRFWPQYARIKELITSGEIGSVRSVAAHRLSKFPDWSDWFRNPARSGGGLLDLQVHDVDFIHWILGHPLTVRTVGIQSPQGSWDHVHTTLTYPEAQASVEASLLMPESWPFSTGIRVLGSKGAIEYTFRVGANIQEREQASHLFRLYKSHGQVCEPAVSEEDMFAAQLRYFVRCVAERRPPLLCLPEETCRVMQVMTASRQSAENGRVITLSEENA